MCCGIQRRQNTVIAIFSNAQCPCGPLVIGGPLAKAWSHGVHIYELEIMQEYCLGFKTLHSMRLVGMRLDMCLVDRPDFDRNCNEQGFGAFCRRNFPRYLCGCHKPLANGVGICARSSIVGAVWPPVAALVIVVVVRAPVVAVACPGLQDALGVVVLVAEEACPPPHPGGHLHGKAKLTSRRVSLMVSVCKHGMVRKGRGTWCCVVQCGCQSTRKPTALHCS